MLRIAPSFRPVGFSPVASPVGYTPVDLDRFLETGDLWQSQMQQPGQLDPSALFAAQLLGALMLDPMALAQLLLMGAGNRRPNNNHRGFGCRLGGLGGRSFAMNRSTPGGWGPQVGNPTGVPGVNGPTGGGTTERLYQAIIKQESGGNYSAVNRDSGALGIGQVMPSNVRSWSREALGYEISPQQFLNSPQLQDKIIKHKLDQYYREARGKGLGEDEAVRYVAAKWYSGSGEKRNSTRPQGGYPSIRAYTYAVLNRYKKTAGTTGATGTPDLRNVDSRGIPDFYNLSPRVQEAALIAKSMGLRVTSTTGGRHTATSNHYRSNHGDNRGHAIDVAGPAHLMARFYDVMRARDPSPRELFYDPRGGIKRGRYIGPIGGHSDHVHYAA